MKSLFCKAGRCPKENATRLAVQFGKQNSRFRRVVDNYILAPELNHFHGHVKALAGHERMW